MNSKSSSKSKLRLILILLTFPLAVLVSEGLSWWWKNPPEPTEGRNVLTYSFPEESPGNVIERVSAGVVEILGCNGGLKGWINADEDSRISVNFFTWDNVDDTGLNHAFHHQPEVCMGNLGREVEAFLPERRVVVDGSELVFDVTEFSEPDGRPLYIFKLSWAEGFDGLNLLREGPNSADQRAFKIRSTLNRWFPRYARVLMLGVYGTDNDDEAWDLVKKEVVGDLSITRLRG